jgi:hypothetical protein
MDGKAAASAARQGQDCWSSIEKQRLRSNFFVCRDGYIDIVTNFAPPRSDILVMVTGPLRKAPF